MITYVVDLEVDAAIAAEYLPWLREHVHEMLALPGFVDAQVFESLDPAPPPGTIAYSVHYRLRDRAAFDEYLRRHATSMRAGGARFGERVRASRTLLQALE